MPYLLQSIQVQSTIHSPHSKSCNFSSKFSLVCVRVPISTAVFLINRLPTPSLHFSSPWEILFGQKPDYSQFKTFGCSCFPLLRPYNQHKLQFRSAECVFLGYTTHSKGHLCLDLSSNKLDTSRHVFYESYFPYHTSISPKVILLKTLHLLPNLLWTLGLVHFFILQLVIIHRF